MAMGAVRVMAAGKAGLESLPIFVDELMAQGIEQLAPWAADHVELAVGKTDLWRLQDETKGRQSEWKGIFEHVGSTPGIEMQVASIAVKVLLGQTNPRAVDDAIQLADSPAQLAAWCRLNINQHCLDTYEMWERFKAIKGFVGESHHLAVVIPYCPEGPTSGTVAMYLGAALRQYFRNKGKAGELVVWGIEICPSLQGVEPGNKFRGYVAREEVLRGVPLSQDSNDETLHTPFDVNIVFDGNTEKGVSSEDYLHEALDRAAAQGTGCLLNGAAGKAAEEGLARLKQGGRWNVFLKHVVSERSYGAASRYLRYQVELPWHHDRKEWDNASTVGKRDLFLRRIDDEIKPRIRHERNGFVKSQINGLVALAERIRRIPLEKKWHNFLFKTHEHTVEEVAELLKQAVREDESSCALAFDRDRSPDNITLSVAPFCLELKLPAEQRRDVAQKFGDNVNSAAPVVDMIGSAGMVALRNSLITRCEEALKRPDCDPMQMGSSAFFDTIIATSIGDWRKGAKKPEFSEQQTLPFLLSPDHRKFAGAFLNLDFNLAELMLRQALDGSDDSQQTTAFKWRLEPLDYFIPVEYTFLVLGSVQEGQGFRDITAYQDLADNYNTIVGVRSLWQQYAKYYGVKPPPELLDDDSDLPPATDASVNGQLAAHPATISEGA